jgi:nitroimidazol reductase NimA-like FMN-containing flavoprotein (pyridoxamine 5'-phosphate oxidase superfamily)
MTQTESGKMSPQMIDEYLALPLIARLATADPDSCQPHAVPVWYAWQDGAIWISSFASTRKVRVLKANPLCSIAIDSAESGWANQAVILEGAAELVTQPRELVYSISTLIYTRYLGEQGVLEADPQSWIHDNENLLIKLTPRKIRAWYAHEIPAQG